MRREITFNIERVPSAYKRLIMKSIVYMEDVLSSPHFFEILKDELSKSNNLEGELSDWKNATAPEIFEHFIMRKFSLDIETYYTIKNTIGYGLAGDDIIRLNTKFLNRYNVDDLEDLCSIGSNLLHEDSHNKGADHDFYNTARRKNCISYIFNRAYERTFRALYGLDVKEEPAILPWYRRWFKWF